MHEDVERHEEPVEIGRAARAVLGYVALHHSRDGGVVDAAPMMAKQEGPAPIPFKSFLVRISRVKDWDGQMDLTGKTVCVRHTWGIGDVLFTTPVIHHIRRKYPGVEVVVLSHFPEVFENNPDVARTLPADFLYQNDFAAWIESDDVWIINFDAQVEGGIGLPQWDGARNDWVIHLVEKQVRGEASDKEEEFVGEWVRRQRSIRLKKDLMEMYLDCGRTPDAERRLRYYPTEREMHGAAAFVADVRRALGPHKKLVAVQAHSSTRYKDYPYFAEVIDRLQDRHGVIVIGAAQHEADAERLGLDGRRALNLVGVFDLRQTAALLKYVDLLIAPETGVVFLRSALDRPSLVLYGNFSAQHSARWFPQIQGLRVPDVAMGGNGHRYCRVPCYVDSLSCVGRDESFAPCMAQLHPDRVVEAAERLLEVVPCP